MHSTQLVPSVTPVRTGIAEPMLYYAHACCDINNKIFFLWKKKTQVKNLILQLNKLEKEQSKPSDGRMK